MKLRPIAITIACLLIGLIALAPAARAEEEQGQDLKAKIKKKMEAILELMKANEAALLKLSTGADAKTRRVDVPVPDGESDSGAGSTGSGAAGEGADGKDAAEKLRRLLEDQGQKGGRIPDELKQLVEMIPL